MACYELIGIILPARAIWASHTRWRTLFKQIVSPPPNKRDKPANAPQIDHATCIPCISCIPGPHLPLRFQDCTPYPGIPCIPCASCHHCAPQAPRLPTLPRYPRHPMCPMPPLCPQVPRLHCPPVAAGHQPGGGKQVHCAAPSPSRRSGQCQALPHVYFYVKIGKQLACALCSSIRSVLGRTACSIK